MVKVLHLHLLETWGRKILKVLVISDSAHNCYGIVSDLLSGLDAIMGLRIVEKLRKVGAVSRDKAVTPEAANLNSQEIGWLQYLAGFLSTIKKTKDGRYYI